MKDLIVDLANQTSRLKTELDVLKDQVSRVQEISHWHRDRIIENGRLISTVRGNSDLIFLRYHELLQVHVNLLSHLRERQVLPGPTVEELTKKFESLKIAVENIII